MNEWEWERESKYYSIAQYDNSTDSSDWTEGVI